MRKVIPILALFLFSLSSALSLHDDLTEATCGDIIEFENDTWIQIFNFHNIYDYQIWKEHGHNPLGLRLHYVIRDSSLYAIGAEIAFCDASFQSQQILDSRTIPLKTVFPDSEKDTLFMNIPANYFYMRNLENNKVCRIEIINGKITYGSIHYKENHPLYKEDNRLVREWGQKADLKLFVEVERDYNSYSDFFKPEYLEFLVKVIPYYKLEELEKYKDRIGGSAYDLKELYGYVVEKKKSHKDIQKILVDKERIFVKKLEPLLDEWEMESKKFCDTLTVKDPRAEEIRAIASDFFINQWKGNTDQPFYLVKPFITVKDTFLTPWTNVDASYEPKKGENVIYMCLDNPKMKGKRLIAQKKYIDRFDSLLKAMPNAPFIVNRYLKGVGNDPRNYIKRFIYFTEKEYHGIIINNFYSIYKKKDDEWINVRSERYETFW